MIRRINVLDKGFVELVEKMGDDHTIIESARVSVLGESKGDTKDKQLLEYLIENHHTSPLEQVEFRFRIKCPLFVRSQIMRHRTASYNEVSRRYTSEELDFYIPEVLRGQAEDNRQASTDNVIKFLFVDAIQNDPGMPVKDYFSYVVDFLKTEYNYLLHSGVAREQARMILPQNCYTKFYMKIDLKNLLHFLALRTDIRAQFETRQFAEAMEKMIADVVPWTYELYLKHKELFK